MTISLAPVRPSSGRPFVSFVQVRPPSVVRKMPRSPVWPQRWPCAATYTMSAFVGWMTTSLMWCVSVRPRLVKVRPPSVDLYTPSPQPMLLRVHDSPVPTHTMSGLGWNTSMSPIFDVPSFWKIRSHVAPPFVDLKMPPEAVAMNTVAGFDSTASMSVMRPTMLAGPIVRHSNARNRVSVGA